MQRSSESIGAIAAALAKAQAELSNPAKSLVGTIRGEGPNAAERMFRYAPLSSGLDIVREVLGKHEIATVQTTAMDTATGMITLTTMLAHVSGEWIASDWPVCPIAETATPHRMGAALTYARRYALFTLVGIAGEDDLDAPDLITPANQTSPPREPERHDHGKLNGAHAGSVRRDQGRRHGPYAPGRRNRQSASGPIKPALGPNESAELRDRLLAELDELGSADAAALWAHQTLAAKNDLTKDDASRVEAAFEVKLAAFAATSDTSPVVQTGAESSVLSQATTNGTNSKKRSRPKAVDKSLLAIPEPRRIRDRGHVQSVARQPCLICGRRPADAHHLRFAQSRALSRKVSDEFTVPLCRGHHREIHRSGNEAGWWQAARIDPIAIARKLWLLSHPLPAGPVRKDPATPALSTAAKSRRASRKSGPNDKTKPIVTVGSP